MKFTGDTLTVKTYDKVVLIDSGYDVFSKKTTVSVPEEWSAIIVQDNKAVTYITHDMHPQFTIKDLKKDGVKMPLLGDNVKIRILFARRHIKHDHEIDNFKPVKCGQTTYSFSFKYSYKIFLMSEKTLTKFALDLKLEPNKYGVMMTFDDINYIIDTVIGGYLKPGSAGIPSVRQTPQQLTYQKYIESIFKEKLFKPLGFICEWANVFRFEVK